MKCKLFLFLMLCLPLGVLAQNFEDKGFASIEKARAASESVMEQMGSDNILLALDELEKFWAIGDGQFDEVQEGIMGDIAGVRERFGKAIGSVVVGEQLVKNLLYQVQGAIKYEQYGMRMVFTFYQGKDDKWYLSNMSWNDKLSEFLQE